MNEQNMIPYDPDFDQVQSSESQNIMEKNGLNNIPPKTIFLGGMIVAFLVLCTIGFFILLPVVF